VRAQCAKPCASLLRHCNIQDQADYVAADLPPGTEARQDSRGGSGWGVGVHALEIPNPRPRYAGPTVVDRVRERFGSWLRMCGRQATYRSRVLAWSMHFPLLANLLLLSKAGWLDEPIRWLPRGAIHTRFKERRLVPFCNCRWSLQTRSRGGRAPRCG
jgi:hypothetical protein